MLAAAVAQLRFALALGTGRPIPGWALDRLIAAARDTAREFGGVAQEATEAIGGPALDAETRRTVQLRRFRTQAARAAGGTGYYGALFAGLGLDPKRLSWEEIARIPPTTKTALRDDPDAFVRLGSRPALRTTTTGTTGRPTQVCFSERELRTMMGLSGLGFLLNGQLGPEDVVLMATSSRATLGNLGLAGGCAHAGALLQPVGLVAPEQTLALLSQPLRLDARVPKVSVLSTYPSYLGELVEAGMRDGFGPADFGLRRVSVGGEVVTAGLLARARRLFGDEVRFDLGYAMTETFPFAGMPCDQGHLHFDPSHGLIELRDPTTGVTGPVEAAAGPGTLVVTPFPPFRETTLLLRYDTEDVVRPVAGPLTCRLRHLPATSDLLGKLRLAVRHDRGWTFPRDVIEVLEAQALVPLPARHGFWPVLGGVAVEAVVRRDDRETREAISAALLAGGVPLAELRLVTDRADLRHPVPLRGDLRELGFAAPPATADGSSPLGRPR